MTGPSRIVAKGRGAAAKGRSRAGLVVRASKVRPSTCYIAGAGLRQPLRVAALAYGPAEALQWAVKERSVDFYDLKADLQALLAPLQPQFVAAEHPALHPGRCAAVQLDGQTIGHLGELHPRWRQAQELPQAPVMFELALEPVLAGRLPVFAPLPRQQSVQRDLALVVGEGVRHDALVGALQADPAGLVRRATLFDVYVPATPVAGLAPGERSLALRLDLLDAAATLTDD